MNTDKTDKGRHTVWLSNEAWNKVNHHYREDNCTFQNEYIEKAIRFYTGYLDTQNASVYLPSGTFRRFWGNKRQPPFQPSGKASALVPLNRPHCGWK